MEQYSYQQQVVEEPSKAKKPIGLQITALVFGIIGLALAFAAYFYTIFSNVGVAIAVENNTFTQEASIASGAGIIADLVIAAFCLIGLILGLVGLVKSIRRATRTVAGIVTSAIGLNLSAGGFVLMIVGMCIAGFFRMIIANGVFQ